MAALKIRKSLILVKFWGYAKRIQSQIFLESDLHELMEDYFVKFLTYRFLYLMKNLLKDHKEVWK